jgi:hypothetical protein
MAENGKKIDVTTTDDHRQGGRNGAYNGIQPLCFHRILKLAQEDALH